MHVSDYTPPPHTHTAEAPDLLKLSSPAGVGCVSVYLNLKVVKVFTKNKKNFNETESLGSAITRKLSSKHKHTCSLIQHKHSSRLTEKAYHNEREDCYHNRIHFLLK